MDALSDAQNIQGFDRATLKRMRCANLEQNKRLEAVEALLDRLEAEVLRRRGEWDAAERRIERDRETLLAEIEEQQRRVRLQREEADRQNLDLETKVRNVTRREAELKVKEENIQRRMNEFERRTNDAQDDRRRIENERTKFEAEHKMLTKEIQKVRDQLASERREVEEAKKTNLRSEQELNAATDQLTRQQAMYDNDVAELQVKKEGEEEKIRERIRSLDEREGDCVRRENAVEELRSAFDRAREEFDQDLQERTNDLIRREEMFRDELMAYQERKKGLKTESEALQSQRVTFQETRTVIEQEQAKRSEDMNGRELNLCQWETALRGREHTLSSKEADYHQREASLRLERGEFEEERNKLSDRCDEKMLKLKEEETKVQHHRSQLDGDLEEFRRQVVELDNRELRMHQWIERRSADLDVTAEALREEKEEQAVGRQETEIEREKIEKREQVLKQNEQKFLAEQQRMHEASMQLRTEREGVEVVMRDVEERERRNDERRVALDRREEDMHSRSLDMDVREDTIRQAERPFLEFKKDLEQKETFLNDREEDLISREDDFRTRMDAANEELRKLTLDRDEELQRIRRQRSELDERERVFEEYRRSTLEDIHRREGDISQAVTALKEDQATWSVDQDLRRRVRRDLQDLLHRYDRLKDVVVDQYEKFRETRSIHHPSQPSIDVGAEDDRGETKIVQKRRSGRGADRDPSVGSGMTLRSSKRLTLDPSGDLHPDPGPSSPKKAKRSDEGEEGGRV